MKAPIYTFIAVALLLTLVPQVGAQADVAQADAQAAYQKVTQERAAKIVATLKLADANQDSTVQNLIAKQYQDLSRIHDGRDARIEQIKSQAGEDKSATEAAIQAARDHAKLELDQLHAAYLAKLSATLSGEQVDKIKDGMTYGVAPATYAVYLKMYPAMTDEQKQQVLAWLHEARELAMDAGDSKAKHAVFGKYKGRINNYLVKEGYDLKAGEANLRESMQKPADNQAK